MPDRYYSEEPIADCSSVVLAGQEAQHLLRVMRAKVGDQIELFDGSGEAFLATIAEAKRNEAVLEIASRETVDRELPADVTIGVALPKGDRQRWLIEKATELGCTKIVPLQTQRGVSQPVDKAIERLRRYVIEASKQCGRNRLMEIAAPVEWSHWLADFDETSTRLVAHPRKLWPGELGDSDRASCSAEELLAPGRNMAIAVGPEGGFTDEEITAAVEHGWRPIDLGPRILRIETAVACLLSAIAMRYVD